jgi:hypothetical protein
LIETHGQEQASQAGRLLVTGNDNPFALLPIQPLQKKNILSEIASYSGLVGHDTSIPRPYSVANSFVHRACLRRR